MAAGRTSGGVWPRSATRAPASGVIDEVPDIFWREVPEGEVEVEGHGRFAGGLIPHGRLPGDPCPVRSLRRCRGRIRRRGLVDRLGETRSRRWPPPPPWQLPRDPRLLVRRHGLLPLAFPQAQLRGTPAGRVGMAVGGPERSERTLPTPGGRNGSTASPTRTSPASAARRRSACIPADKACRVFATSPATSGSGAVTNTPSRDRRSRSAPRIACGAVVPGASFRTTRVQTTIR